MDVYTALTLAFLSLSVFILCFRCYYACCYVPSDKTTVSVITTQSQPPPSYAVAMAVNPNQRTNQPQPLSELNSNVSTPRTTTTINNNNANIYPLNPKPTIQAYAAPSSKIPSWQIDPSKAGNHKFQLPPPTYKP